MQMKYKNCVQLKAWRYNAKQEYQISITPPQAYNCIVNK